jgi:hypothetical protein
MTKRQIPTKPTTDDPTGGYRQMLSTQMLIACVVTALLFCTSTGMLEAWCVAGRGRASAPTVSTRVTLMYP